MINSDVYELGDRIHSLEIVSEVMKKLAVSAKMPEMVSIT
jgi:hypothetical protein